MFQINLRSNQQGLGSTNRSLLYRNAIAAAINGRDIAYKRFSYDQAFFNLGIDSAAYVGLDSGGRKGLFAEEATQRSALLSVPLSSCLICGNDMRSLSFGAAQRLFPERLSVILNKQLPRQGPLGAQVTLHACRSIFMSTLLSSTTQSLSYRYSMQVKAHFLLKLQR